MAQSDFFLDEDINRRDVPALKVHPMVVGLNGENLFTNEGDAVIVQPPVFFDFFDVLTPDGAFYVFADCRALMGKSTLAGKALETDMDVAMYLMEEAGVAVVPGSGFLADGFFRISYAAAEAELTAACADIHAAVNKLA